MSAGPVAHVAAESEIVLRDGSTVHVRPSTMADLGRVREFLAALSDRSRWFRFFSAGVNLDAAARGAVAPAEGLSLIALRGGVVIGHGTYVGARAERAEVAFAVADAWHGHGIATVLLAHLAHAASAAGIATFDATVLSENRHMLGVFHDSGFPVASRRSEGAIEIEFPTSLSRAARHRFEHRQRAADVAAVAHVLRPASVAVIGASERAGCIGAEVVRNLLAAGFTGRLHLVAASAGALLGAPAVATLGEVQDDVELAVIAVPAEAVVDAARACAGKRVRALVVLTPGFGGAAPDERARREELLSVCRVAGMRLVGPDCLGVASLGEETALNATYARVPLTAGRVAFAAQSGASGIAALSEAAARGLGLSSFVSMGDKADLSGNDFLEYWEQDPATSVVLLYLESFGNPRRFGRIARRISAAKPIVAVKSGGRAGVARVVSSRTGALLAASDGTVDALFAHAGVLRAGTVGEMFDVAGLLARQPLPQGDRVAVLTDAVGPAVLFVDACDPAGLRVPPLSEATRAKLADAVPGGAAVMNPVHMAAFATADRYERCLRILLDDDGVDAVVVILGHQPVGGAGQVARGIDAAANGAELPVLTVSLGTQAPTAAGTGTVASFTTPEDAARALGHAVRHARRRAAPPDEPFEPADAAIATAATIVAEGLGRGGGWLAPADVERFLRCWGIGVVESRLVASVQAAERAAEELGGAVALKAVTPGLVHKSDAGAVRLGLIGPTAVSRAARDMAAHLDDADVAVEGFHVQRMAPVGTELVIGAVSDPAFGPLVACGAGGVAVELLGDVQVRLAPLGPREADGMLRGLRSFPLLDGYRGRPRADLDAIGDVVTRVGALAATHPAVAELDLDPVIATTAGALVVDARVRLEAAAPTAPFPSLNV